MKRTKTITLTAAITAIFLGATIFSACTKSSNNNADPCSSITCQNGGTCANGVCTCPTGYTGTNCGTLATTQIQFTNTTFTPITITVNSINSTIPVGGTVSYSGTYGSTLNFTANTYGQTSTGVQVGEAISWNTSVTFPSSSSLNYDLFVPSTYFFLKMQNADASYSAQGLYVNYGTTAQTLDNTFTIPNNGTTYNIGYYNAYTNTELYVLSNPSGVHWSYYPTFTFTANQTTTFSLN